MKMFIGLVTPDEVLRTHFGRGKEGVIPTDALDRGFFLNRGLTVDFGAYSPEMAPSTDDLEKMLLGRTKDAAICLLLIDRRWAYLAQNIRDACFSALFDLNNFDGNCRNFFHKTMSRFLRSFSTLAQIFENGDDKQLIALPLRNFDAPELLEIARLCRDENQTGVFTNEIQKQLMRLRMRRRPRRQATYKTVYAVDNVPRFFVFGKETHSRFGTGSPHKPHCEMNGYFRFGRRIDSDRHYNVSETEKDETSVNGNFTDCHDTLLRVEAGKTHLNMFSNDYF